MATVKDPINIVAAFGLSLGAVFGMAGTFVVQPNLQALLWAIDGAGLVMAAALLSLKYFRTGQDFVAAGFLVFAIAEAVLLSGTAGGLAASVPSFGAGSALWATALLLISIQRQFPPVVRLSGLGSAVLFAVVAARIFLGPSTVADLLAVAVFCTPFACHHLHRLDLEPSGQLRMKAGVGPCARSVCSLRYLFVAHQIP
jgi:hypothetical protein